MRISERYEQFTTDRVNPTKSNATKATDAATSSSSSATAAASATAQGAVLSVSVSDQARGLAAGNARIEQLREQVRNGTFKVDAKDIANKLVGQDA